MLRPRLKATGLDLIWFPWILLGCVLAIFTLTKLFTWDTFNKLCICFSSAILNFTVEVCFARIYWCFSWIGGNVNQWAAMHRWEVMHHWESSNRENMLTFPCAYTCTYAWMHCTRCIRSRNHWCGANLESHCGNGAANFYCNSEKQFCNWCFSNVELPLAITHCKTHTQWLINHFHKAAVLKLGWI